VTDGTDGTGGRCFHCLKPCGEDDYCHGCKTVVCEQCSPYYDGPGGDHAPEEHLLYFEPLTDGEHTCRWRVGAGPGTWPRFCGAPAFRSAYCVGHLHAVIDRIAATERPS
jgi:hypothetical protein